MPDGNNNNLNYQLNNKVIAISEPRKYSANLKDEHNLILNRNFENGLTSWNGIGFSIAKTYSSESKTVKEIIGLKSLSVSGDQYVTKKISQSITLNGQAGDPFVLSFFVKGNIPKSSPK